MPRVCAFTGKKTSFGKKRAWSGQAITKGGFGLKPTGITARQFKPNLQNVTAMIDGVPTRIKASTRAIRRGAGGGRVGRQPGGGRAAQRRSVHDRIEAEIGLADRTVNSADHALVPYGHRDHARLPQLCRLADAQ